MKKTILTNIFNEEYLLPFWLEHHKEIFDHGIIIDHHSTDRSIEICKEIVPTWEIRTTNNKDFGIIETDNEFMDIEKEIEGIKIILNITEFLIVDCSLSSFFFDKNNFKCYKIKTWTPFPSILNDKQFFFPNSNKQLFKSLLNVKGNFTHRSSRFIHNYSHGNYTIGRHHTQLPFILTNEMFIIWFGFYPWNPALIKRKLQIEDKITERDRICGFGEQHLWSIETIQKIIILNYNTNSVFPYQATEKECYYILQKKYENFLSQSTITPPLIHIPQYSPFYIQK